MDSTDRNSFGQPEDETVGSRAKSRDSLFLTGRVRLPDEPVPRDVRIRNLSEGGLMIEIERLVAVGTPVILALRGIGEVAGKVAWCAERRIGIALDERIDPKLARKPVGGGERTPSFAKAQLG